MNKRYPEYDLESDDYNFAIFNGKATFLSCADPHTEDGVKLGLDEWCQDYENYLYPTITSLSVIFLIITLIVHIAEDSLRFIIVLYNQI